MPICQYNYFHIQTLWFQSYHCSGGRANLQPQAHEFANIVQQVHFINLMTYDFASGTKKMTGFNASQSAVEITFIQDQPRLAFQTKCFNSTKTFLWVSAPAEQFVLGIGLCGHSFQLSDPSPNTPGSPISGKGATGPYTDECRILDFNMLRYGRVTGRQPMTIIIRRSMFVLGING